MSRFFRQLIGRERPGLEAEPRAEVHDGCRVFSRGYIANVAALTAEAARRNETLADSSPAALFAKAYRWWCEALPSHVLGEYAVAVFDEPASKLLLTHDSLGLVPLFYFEEPGTFAFASHLEDLVPLAETDDLDPEYIADFLATGQALGARTPYRRIRRLLPGHSLLFNNHRIRVRKTWDMARIAPATLRNDEEYAERFLALLAEGVRAALQGDGKVWCELSGGLDSSSLFSIAARTGRAELEAISFVSTSCRHGDEREWMNAVLAEHPLPWHTLDVDETRPFSELPGHFCAEPCPSLIGAALLRRYLGVAESHGVRVILCGVGGDQVCAGDRPRPYHLADSLPLHLPRLLSSLRRWRASDAEERSLMYVVLANVLRPSARYWRRRSLTVSAAGRVPPWIHPDYRRQMGLDRRNTASVVPRCRSVGQQYLAERIGRVGFAPTLAWEPSAASIEIRKPFLYRPLVEFMLAIPSEQIFQPGQDRALQRRALTDILPERIRQRMDKTSLVEAYFEGLRNGTWTEMLSRGPCLVKRGYVDSRLWGEAVDRARYGRMPSMKLFIAAAVLELWLRQLEDVRPDVGCALAAHA
jgi:asparagine synthase (glutamine-hydrolysing)